MKGLQVCVSTTALKEFSGLLYLHFSDLHYFVLVFFFLAQTPALHWQTEYTHDYKGARGRPSTTER